MFSCYGIREATDMTHARISFWDRKVGQGQLRSTSFSALPPTTESFEENVKRAHIQTVLWLTTHHGSLPNIDPTLFGWMKNDENKRLVPVASPKDTCIAPNYIIAMTKCSCKTDEPCSSGRCSCRENGIACSIMCQCLQYDKKYHNPHNIFPESVRYSDVDDP